MPSLGAKQLAQQPYQHVRRTPLLVVGVHAIQELSGYANRLLRTQPWSTYSVLQTTITAWAFPYDAFMLYSWYQASQNWSLEHRQVLFAALLSWTFLFSKTVKLWGHFIRHPVDILFLPVYILFGYFHGAIKAYGLFTLNAVS